MEHPCGSQRQVSWGSTAVGCDHGAQAASGVGAGAMEHPCGSQRLQNPIAAAGTASEPSPESTTAPTVAGSAPKTLQDLVTTLSTDKPWQEVKYTAESAVWQGAAQRCRAHPRRTNVSLGTCSVDLSGPHEPTPRPGGPFTRNPCHYFLALHGETRYDGSNSRSELSDHE